MELSKAINASKSGCARARKHGKTITCQSGVVTNQAAIYAHVYAGYQMQRRDTGYEVYVEEVAQPTSDWTVKLLWEVEASIRVNYGLEDLDWQPHTIEEES